MSIGFTATNIATQVVPDRTLTSTTTANVRTAKFGEGYEQRVATGINNISNEFALTFSNRSKVEVDDIVTFFESTSGVTAFNFTIPDTNSTSVTTGTTTGASSVTITLTAANPNISVGATIGGSFVGTGSTTVTAVSGTTVTMSETRSISTNTDLTFTNPNEKTFKVVCAAWNVVYLHKNFYTLDTSFKRVYEP